MEHTQNDTRLQEVIRLSQQGLKNRIHQVIHAAALTLMAMILLFHNLQMGLFAATAVAGFAALVIYNLEYSHHHFQLYRIR